MKENNTDFQNRKHYLQGDVSGSITVSKGNRQYNKQITSKSSFFKDEIKYKITNDSIYFMRIGLDDKVRILKPTMDKNKYYHFHITIDEIEEKKYYFEDDSTEDCIRIYYR